MAIPSIGHPVRCPLDPASRSAGCASCRPGDRQSHPAVGSGRAGLASRPKPVRPDRPLQAGGDRGKALRRGVGRDASIHTGYDRRNDEGRRAPFPDPRHGEVSRDAPPDLRNVRSHRSGAMLPAFLFSSASQPDRRDIPVSGVPVVRLFVVLHGAPCAGPTQPRTGRGNGAGATRGEMRFPYRRLTSKAGTSVRCLDCTFRSGRRGSSAHRNSSWRPISPLRPVPPLGCRPRKRPQWTPAQSGWARLSSLMTA